MKVSIVGIGRVGKAVAFALVTRELIDHLVLIGRTPESGRGDAMDLRHASCMSRPVIVHTGGVPESAGSDIVILTAAAGHDRVSRRNTARINADLFRGIVPDLARVSPDAVFIVVSNPVEPLTYVTQECSGLPHQRVIGAGTLLDTMRLRALLAERCAVHPVDIRAYVLGEHGDSQVAAISSASVGGAPLELSGAEIASLADEARIAGTRVAREKGYTDYAIALATVMIADAVIHDSHAVLPVSTRLHDYCGIDDVCMSVPAIVGKQGILRTLPIRMNADELAAFKQSADVLRQTTRACQ